MSTVDHVGRWFVLLEHEGECMDIRFGRVDRSTWDRIPHREFDGIGGLAEVLRREGTAFEGMPRLNRPKPGLWARFVAFLKHAGRRPKRPAPWRGYAERMGKWDLPTSIAWRAFSREETQALEARAKAKGASLNSFLLHSLDLAISPGLDEGPHYWMIPVNLRGGVKLARDTANHACFLTAEAPADGTPAALHAEVRQLLEQNAHWGCWGALSIGRWVGMKGMRAIIDSERREGRAWVGAFSNLGDWRGDGPARLFAPPVARQQPFGAGCMTWNGELTVTIQFHAALTSDPQVARGWLERWVAILEA